MNIFHKHLHIWEKSSTFALAFDKFGVYDTIPSYTILYYPTPPFTTLLPLWLSW